MQEFEGKTAVVTGAASGIGRGIAERFAQEGMKVVLADIEEWRLEEAVAELRGKGIEVTGVVADVTSPESMEALREAAVAAYGNVHVLVSNAGATGEDPSKPLWEATPMDWEWTIAVNVKGMANGMRAFVPHMLEHREPSHIVNTSSIAGLTSGDGGPIYAVTKHAIVVASESLYRQLRQRKANVGVSVLCPGMVDTHIFSGQRNRPAEMFDEGRAPSDQEREALRQAPSTSQLPQFRDGQFKGEWITPLEVGELVVKGIREERFYVIATDESDGAIRERFERILARENPAMGGG